jgi:ribonuclease Z
MADYTGHTTALEAATIAQKAQVGKLILGTFFQQIWRSDSIYR